MKQATTTESSKTPSRLRPGLKPETDENQCMSLAMDIAKQQLNDGTASKNLVMHFVRQASPTEQLKRQLLQAQIDLAKAKKEALDSQAKVEQLFTQAMKAMQRYSGYGDGEEEPDANLY